MPPVLLMEKRIIPENTVTLGHYAQQVIEEQFTQIVSQEAAVLADVDPEHLHQMRVGTRKLRTALQVFHPVVRLPKAADSKRVRDLAQVLGALRDVDVQMADLQDYYRPRLIATALTHLEKLLTVLLKQRRKAFRQVEQELYTERYQVLKTSYRGWIAQPAFTPVAQRPLLPLLPHLLSPLLGQLLLHPGWLMTTPATPEDGVVLHALRKEIKHVRYLAEFFTNFYGSEFKVWIKTLKKLQDALGMIQDTFVLTELIHDEVPEAVTHFLPLITERRTQALEGWQNMREPYLASSYLQHLGQLIHQRFEY
jgi:CHAD domain-containing protein